jgi:phenylalanyl-tRNA synthetase beta chain
MKLSAQWLREWVNPKLRPEALAERLTRAGLEVDAIAPVAPALDRVVVGEILEAGAHPSADKLRLCRVRVAANEVLTIVCGAANAATGMKAPVALPGATLPNGLVIQKTEIRGVASSGMLCSAAELGLEEEASTGLLVLEAGAKVGQSISHQLGLDDVTLELEPTPNRGDCLSVLGTAREIAALTGATLAAPKTKTVKRQSTRKLTVKLRAPKDCPRYVGRVIEGIQRDAVTPLWLRERLRRSGVRSIHPVVDVTNYVMLELGQPMHAFDLGKLKGGIEVRRAKPGEALSLLDGKSITLTADMLVIADSTGPVALAGIMGGAPTAVDAQTTDIFLESAWFHPDAIAGRARTLGLQTDSSQRFERGVDPALAGRAMARATALLVDIVGGRPGPLIESESARDLPRRKPIALRAARIELMLGQAIPDKVVTGALTRLGMKLSRTTGGWRVLPPSWRFDMEREIDLIEEIARVYGYDKIAPRRPTGTLTAMPIPESTLPAERLRTALADRDYQEVITYSFVDPALQSLLDPHATALRLANPIASDMADMRTSLWPGLIKAVLHNQNRQLDRLRFFEIGRCFIQAGHTLAQPPRLGVAVTGPAWPKQWGLPQRAADFFDAKGDVEALLALTGSADDFRFEPAQHPALHPGQTARVARAGKPVGWIGSLHPVLHGKLGLNQPVVLVELDLAAITDARTPEFREISKFPSIRRDLAVIVEQKIPAQMLLDTVARAAGNLLVNLELFDEYRGEGIDSGRKSLALGLTFQDSSRTLKENEIEALLERVLTTLEQDLGAQLRR